MAQRCNPTVLGEGIISNLCCFIFECFCKTSFGSLGSFLVFLRASQNRPDLVKIGEKYVSNASLAVGNVFFRVGLDSGTSEPSKSCWRLENSHISIKSRFLVLVSIFIDSSRILVALGYLLVGKGFKNEVLKNCMKIMSLFLLIFVISGRFWDALGGPRGGISWDLPGHPAPFFTPECPKGPQRYPQSDFSSFLGNFQSIFSLISESFLSIFELM